MGVATHTPPGSGSKTTIDDTESSFKMLKNGSSLPEINVSGKILLEYIQEEEKVKHLLK